MACFTVKEAKEAWDWAKEKYGKVPGPHGYPDFKELTNLLSEDIFKATGGQIVNGKRVGGRFLTPEEVAKLLTTPKAIRNARNSLLLADRTKSSWLNQAREFTAGQEKTPLSRFTRSVYESPYAGKTLFHSAALHMTHAWPYLFDPKMWPAFGKSWVNSWKAMSESNARSIAESIKLSPKYDEMIKSGLPINPDTVYDDIQNRVSFWGKLGRMSAHQFLGLKQLRQMAWEGTWDRVPDHLKTDEMRKLLSTGVAHMTGAPGPEGRQAMSGKFGRAARIVAFAPSLDVARAMRPIDLLKSIGVEGRTQLNKLPKVGEQLKQFWGKASPEQQWIARENMKQWARITGVISSLLYLNHQMLKHFYGSKEDINVHDPFKADWMAFKMPDGKILQATGGQVPMIRTAVRVVGKPARASDAIGNYVMGKLNPALGLALELRKGKGFGGTEIPAPFGTQPATAGNYAEFLTAELGPIATEEGIHEFAKQMRDQTGVDQAWHEKLLRGFRDAAYVTVPAAFGMHLYEPSKPKETGGAMPFR